MVKLEAIWDDTLTVIVGNFCPECQIMFPKGQVKCDSCEDDEDEDQCNFFPNSGFRNPSLGPQFNDYGNDEIDKKKWEVENPPFFNPEK